MIFVEARSRASSLLVSGYFGLCENCRKQWVNILTQACDQQNGSGFPLMVKPTDFATAVKRMRESSSLFQLFPLHLMHIGAVAGTQRKGMRATYHRYVSHTGDVRMGRLYSVCTLAEQCEVGTCFSSSARVMSESVHLRSKRDSLQGPEQNIEISLKFLYRKRGQMKSLHETVVISRRSYGKTSKGLKFLKGKHRLDRFVRQDERENTLRSIAQIFVFVLGLREADEAREVAGKRSKQENRPEGRY